MYTLNILQFHMSTEYIDKTEINSFIYCTGDQRSMYLLNGWVTGSLCALTMDFCFEE